MQAERRVITGREESLEANMIRLNDIAATKALGAFPGRFEDVSEEELACES